jgi:hypothetical protein
MGVMFPSESESAAWGPHHDIHAYACEQEAAGGLPEMTLRGTLFCHGEEYPWRHSISISKRPKV